MGQRGPVAAASRYQRSGPLDTPPPPDYLSDRLADEWALVWAYLDESGQGHRVDASLVESYIAALHLADRARIEHEDAGAPLTATGSTGQPVEHPLLRLQRDAMRDAARYGAALGISPTSRARLNVKAPTTGAYLSAVEAAIGPSPRRNAA